MFQCTRREAVSLGPFVLICGRIESRLAGFVSSALLGSEPKDP